MKLKFKNQAFQMDAVNAVVDLFAGQEKTRSTFSVMEEAQTNFLNELGQGNALYIDQETLTANMHTVQKRNNLPLTPTAEGCQFCIEMETGTGKTYVYTKTIFELNRKYGFTKFVIVVPSVAIREGVYKSFQVTQEHFGLQYDNVPCRYFIYNSAKLSDVRQFATSSNIEVMIIKVDKYRHEDGTPGIYATMFEECYQELIAKPKYALLRERFTTDVSKVHNGYFSQDKKGRLKDTKGDTQADDDTYNTIMRDKEWLLSFECPLRFIFSHSALREGWDNPNVFQVCTLIEQKSTFTCRQKVGRGLRLCVNQDGERIEDKNINVLHVMANESFSEFASTLQKEIEDETGVKFGVLQLSLFAGMTYQEEVTREHTIDREEAHELVKTWMDDGSIDKWMADPEMTAAEEKITAELESGKITEPPSPVTEVMRQIKNGATAEQAAEAIIGITSTITTVEEHTVTHEEATELLEHFEQKGYITSTGKVKDTMKNALKNGTLDLPKKYEAARERFEQIIANADRKPPVRDASRDVVVRLNKQVMLSPEFLELWSKIKQKTAYRVSIDTEQLVKNCVKAFQEMPHIPKTRLVSQTADIHIQQSGISHMEREMRTMEIANDYQALPDIITAISDETLLTPATVNRILVESGRCGDFLNNPEAFLEQAVELIRSHRHALAIDGIRYVKLDGQEYYVQEIFDTTELLANLDRNAVKVEHSVYDYVVYDSSTVEKPVAVALDNDPDVKMFFKIPSRFKIETPIGTYNPDWAVYLNKNGEEKLYFVLETKGDTSFMHLKTSEQLKIHCGKEHFKALDAGVELETATSWTELRKRI